MLADGEKKGVPGEHRGERAWLIFVGEGTERHRVNPEREYRVAKGVGPGTRQAELESKLSALLGTLLHLVVSLFPTLESRKICRYLSPRFIAGVQWVNICKALKKYLILWEQTHITSVIIIIGKKLYLHSRLCSRQPAYFAGDQRYRNISMVAKEGGGLAWGSFPGNQACGWKCQIQPGEIWGRRKSFHGFVQVGTTEEEYSTGQAGGTVSV